MDKEKISYLAGLFDGEGCITYKKYYRKKKDRLKGYECWSIRLEVAMTDKPAVEYFKEILGIGRVNSKLRRTPPHAKSKWKDQWRWTCWHRDALKVCKLFLPYAKVKLNKINSVINHYDKKSRQT